VKTPKTWYFFPFLQQYVVKKLLNLAKYFQKGIEIEAKI